MKHFLHPQKKRPSKPSIALRKLLSTTPSVRRPIPTNVTSGFCPSLVRQRLRTHHHWPLHLNRKDGDVFFVKLEATDEVGRLPVSFSRSYFNTVRTRVTLTDPKGNVTLMKVLKRKGFVFLTDAWKFVGRFYGLYLGGWIRLSYNESGNFDIEVANHDGKEVEYPPMPEALDVEGSESSVDSKSKGNPKVVVDYSGVTHIFTKWLTPDDIYGNCMTITKEFCKDALPVSDAMVCVIDDEGSGWTCRLLHDVDKDGNCGIVRGWSSFVKYMGFEPGQCVNFGVFHANANVLFYIP